MSASEPDAWAKARESLMQVQSPSTNHLGSLQSSYLNTQTSNPYHPYATNAYSGFGYMNFASNPYNASSQIQRPPPAIPSQSASHILTNPLPHSVPPFNSYPSGYASANPSQLNAQARNSLYQPVAVAARPQYPFVPQQVQHTFRKDNVFKRSDGGPLLPKDNPQQLPPPPPPPPQQVHAQPAQQEFGQSAAASGKIMFSMPNKKAQAKAAQLAPVFGSDAISRPVSQGNPINGQSLEKKNGPTAVVKEDSFPGSCSSSAPAQPSKSKSNSIGSADWPESLKNYVNEAFSRCKNDLDKDRVEIMLKGKLTLAYNEGTVWIKDWSKEPLISLGHEQHSNQSALASSPRGSVSSVASSMKGGGGRHGSSRREHSEDRSYRSRRRSDSSSSYSSSSSRSPKYSSRGFAKRKRDSSRENDFIPISKSAKRGNNSQLNGNSTSAKTKNNKKNKNKKQKGKPVAVDTKMMSTYGLNPEMKRLRAQRFGSDSNGNARRHNVVSVFAEADAMDLESATPIVGSCLDLEKRYLRLTTAPDPSTVRPLYILKKSLHLIKEKYGKEPDLSYRYLCEQLKSIRQDLTVQCIRDAFTVDVYETHARIALEKKDHEEFNQCQSQLRVLYEEVNGKNRLEFVGYLILYNIFSETESELQILLQSLNDEECEHEVVAHALRVRKAWSLKNYFALMREYKKAPAMSSYLMDWFLPRERKNALKAVIKAYRPTVPVSFVQQALVFATIDECTKFLSQFSLAYSKSDLIDCKNSQVVPLQTE